MKEPCTDQIVVINEAIDCGPVGAIIIHENGRTL